MSSHSWVPTHNSRNMYDRYHGYVARQKQSPAEAAPQQAAQQELGFGDFLDIVNPLQHLPVVGSVYRAVSGDDISDASRVMGGALYGGPIGATVAVASVAFKNETGLSADETAVAMINGDEAEAPPAMLAMAEVEEALPWRTPTPQEKPEAPARFATPQLEPSAALVASLMGQDASDAGLTGGPEAPIPLDAASLLPEARPSGTKLSKEEAIQAVMASLAGISKAEAFPDKL